mmetsp:Transcript_2301/g.3330  ORF Transcript_2301/g.3330 Transcript_2301/m.3330 type:complete len:221 (+) Transcript_2301:494-1156(+)
MILFQLVMRVEVTFTQHIDQCLNAINTFLLSNLCLFRLAMHKANGKMLKAFTSGGDSSFVLGEIFRRWVTIMCLRRQIEMNGVGWSVKTSANNRKSKKRKVHVSFDWWKMLIVMIHVSKLVRRNCVQHGLKKSANDKKHSPNVNKRPEKRPRPKKNVHNVLNKRNAMQKLPKKQSVNASRLHSMPSVLSCVKHALNTAKVLIRKSWNASASNSTYNNLMR